MSLHQTSKTGASSHELRPRIAICIYDGLLSEDEAKAIADRCHRTREANPEGWAKANRRWRAVASEKYGQGKMKQAHAALKAKHGVESFTELTVGEILASVERMEG